MTSMRYRAIVADPAWPYERGLPRWTTNGVDNSDNLPYPTMTLSEIAALAVQDLAAPQAHLYLWTTNAFLEEAWEIARKWGFKPSTVLVWCKPARGFAGRATFSTCTEFVLFAYRGATNAKTQIYRNWWEWPRAEHSRKPDAFYDLVESVSHGPYLEMFSRRARLGWDVWGNEVDTEVVLSDLGNGAIHERLS